MAHTAGNGADDTEDQKRIRDCIENARQAAGDDPGEFIRLLNDCYVTTRARAGLTLRAAAGPDRTPKARQIAEDPRYLRNAMKLARRTQGGVRVIGGMPVPKGEFLDCVAVGNDSQWGCTGTLIAPDVVVTAGHCTDFATRVFFGGDVNGKGRTIAVSKCIRHPGYIPNVFRDDLMVLTLSERMESIDPRRIADTTTIDAATDGRVVGFGNTDPRGRAGYGIKRQVDVPIASNACTGLRKGDADGVAYGCHREMEIVAGKPLLAKDSCTGDSGGPFYVATPSGEWVVAGATSRPTNASDHDCGDGGIYVRLDRYRNWIVTVSGSTLS